MKEFLIIFKFLLIILAKIIVCVRWNSLESDYSLSFLQGAYITNHILNHFNKFHKLAMSAKREVMWGKRETQL